MIASLKTKGLFWFLRKTSLFITANTNLKQVTQFVENLGLTNPHNQITESNIGDWSDFIHRLEEIANDGESASNYFSALEELQSTELFKVVNKNLETSTQFIEVLGVSNPDDLITPSNLNDWKDFTSHYLKNVIKNAESVSKYLNALEKLQNTKSLEDISLEKQQLFLSISKNSEKLWEKWLRLQPSKLSSEDRDKLAKYIPLIKMVSKAAPGTGTKIS